MSFDPYVDNPLVEPGEAKGLNWRWAYLDSLGLPPDEVNLDVARVAETLYRLIGPDPERARTALRLLDLVERGLEIYGEVGAWAPVTGQTWVGLGLNDEFEGASLAEAVKAALAELGE